MAEQFFILIIFELILGIGRKLKIRIIIWGVLLIVGGMADYIIMPSMLSSVNDLTDSMQRNVMSGLLGNAHASTSFSSASTEMSSAINPFRLLLTPIEHYMQMVLLLWVLPE